MAKKSKLISIIVPCYNEAAGIDSFYESLAGILDSLAYRYEVIFINDGSRDQTLSKLQALAGKHSAVRVLSLARNFGKEIALSAGIQYAAGNAVLMLDADGQYPVGMIPEFIRRWETGALVVTGVRESNRREGFVKRNGSKLFYKLLGGLTKLQVVPHTTDFRLIDEIVRREFIGLTEHGRMTRGLIDWFGFEQSYVPFHASARKDGEAGYGIGKLVHLALNGFVSLSLKPLYFSFYMGLIVLPLSILLGLFSVVEMLIGDPMGLNITGTAYLVILALFLIGLLLVSQGITALYLSHIHTETQNRPLFVVDEQASRNLG